MNDLTQIVARCPEMPLFILNYTGSGGSADHDHGRDHRHAAGESKCSIFFENNFAQVLDTSRQETGSLTQAGFLNFAHYLFNSVPGG